MAAAETAPAAGSRRAVVRSERFVQWQRQLSSARRAPYGSRKRIDNGKIAGIQNFQKERAMLDGGGEEADRDGSGISQERIQYHQQESVDCIRPERASSAQFCENGPSDVTDFACCNGPQGEQERHLEPLQGEEELLPMRPLTRRGRRTLDKDQERQLSAKGEGENSNAAGSKRSTRFLTRAQSTEGIPPPPLKLPKLHIVLSRKEVQEDWIKITGRRYTGKPRKSALANLGLELCTAMTCASTLRRYLSDS